MRSAPVSELGRCRVVEVTGTPAGCRVGLVAGGAVEVWDAGWEGGRCVVVSAVRKARRSVRHAVICSGGKAGECSAALVRRSVRAKS